MKRFLTLLTITMTCLALFSTVAEARRLGGGTSFGKQRTMPAQQAQKAPAAAPAPAPAAPAAAPGNRWLGPLAGLAIGAGLASMFAGGGMGSMMGPILLALLVAAVVMFMLARLKKSQQPAMQYSGTPFNTPQPVQPPSYSEQAYAGSSTPMAAPVASNIPHDFPVDSFLRNGKTSFIRLQAANDRKDLNDIREYTTPEMFAEISMQMQERGDAMQKTDVMNINAELLEVANEGDYSIASVRFTGQTRENNGAPESFDEVWHVQKYLLDDKAVWLLAGIQQVNLQ